MISVIIPARNASSTIGRTLGSLVHDKAVVAEILLVDDGSEDDTVGVARKAAEQHGLPLTATAVGFGNAGAARNAGLARAGGTRLFFLDADDEVIPGGVTLLDRALNATRGAGIAIGASIHRGRMSDKLKLPGSYGSDRRANARRYLANEMRSITVGSALLSAEAVTGIRFPESIGLDEDTIYWAAVLSRCSVVTIQQPVLVYNLDEARMARRFVDNPGKVFLEIAREIDGLSVYDIGSDAQRMRKGFIAMRIARHLIRRRRYSEAAAMVQIAQSHGSGFRPSLKSLQYRIRIGAGRTVQAFGLGRVPDEHEETLPSGLAAGSDR